MTSIEQQFHRAQARLKSNRKVNPALAQKAATPLFNPELVGTRPSTNVERSVSYRIRRVNRGMAA